MSDKTRKKRAELLSLVSLLAAGLILPAAGSLPEPMVVPSAESAEKTSEQRAAVALYQLGVMRMNGEEGEQDISAGRYWIHLAARHGYPLAQYNLGVMYFDGIGGEYNRPCAQWWLTRAAGQDDTEVHQMAEQALQDVLPEMAGLPKVYRPVTAAECDRLPEWRSVTDIDVLPPGDIDTGKRVITQEDDIPGETALIPADSAVVAVQDGEDPIVAETDTVTATVTAAVPVITYGDDSGSDAVAMSPANVSETDKPKPAVTGEPAGKEAEVISEPDRGKAGKADETEVSAEKNITEPAGDQAVPPQADADNTGHSKDGKTGVSVTISPQVPDSAESAGKTAAPAETPAEAEVGAKTQKSSATRPVPALNLGGSPATAPGKHYTLQLSSGTTPDELYRTARRYKLTNYVVYETERHGRRWYVLVAGEYATLTAANQALKALPAELRRNGPWVRSVRQVQNELKVIK